MSFRAKKPDELEYDAAGNILNELPPKPEKATPNYEIKVSRLTEEPIPDYPIEIQFGRDILGCNLSEVEALTLFKGLFKVLGKPAKEFVEGEMCDGCEIPCEDCADREQRSYAEEMFDARNDLD